MRIHELLLAILTVIILILAGYIHYDAQRSCLTSQKPKTASTGHRFVSPFTGEYKRFDGHLYCYDSRGVLHKYRNTSLHHIL